MSGNGIPWTYVLLPPLFAVQIVAMIGLAYVLSAAAVYLRDLKDVVVIFSLAGLYIVPVVYLPGWVPAAFRPILYANPFSYMVWCYQDVFYFGRIEHPLAWLVFPAAALVAFKGGHALFSRSKIFFGNFL